MAIALDYTQVDISDDGATFGTAIRTQFQNAQSDLGNRPEKASNEIIFGNWTFAGVPTFSSGFNAGGGTIDGQLKMESTLQIDGNSTGQLIFTGTVPVYGNPVFLGNPKMQGGVDLHAPGASGDVTVAEITMEEIQSGNSNPNGVKITKRDGGRFVDIVILNDGVEKTGSELSIDTLAGNYNFGDDAILKIGRFRLTATAPLTSSSSGAKYEIATDSNYIYVCVNPKTWKRVALSSW